MAKKYIIDTDIGDDIDDAFAIAQAIDYGLEIIGVTTVFKNVLERTQIARKLLKLFNRSDIPVFCGLGEGLNGKLRTNERLCQWTEDLPEYAAEQDKDGALAVDFLIESAAKYKDELVIMAIGPLTNIATAIKRAPEVMKGVGKVLLMGGDYSRQYCEWNIICDLEASNVVFSSECPLVCVGYDVTVQTRMSQSEEKRVLETDCNNEERAYLKELYTLWRKDRPETVRLELHDPLTVYYEVNPSAFSMKEGKILLETSGTLTRGMTLDADVFDRRKGGKKILFAESADILLFKKQFFEITCLINSDGNNR
ncbi:MAG: nucleoside hydrolase [Clostridia bacterium]|nr:nucleoside hydrolase [Clostridia bacterium]